MTNIIPFRQIDLTHSHCIDREPLTYKVPLKQVEKEVPKKPVSIEVMPWESLPKGHPDYRPLLQRDGLILMSWERWEDAIKVVWCTSNIGRMAKYQAWVKRDEFASVYPESRYQKGRYGYRKEEEPEYIVYTAPLGLSVNTLDAFIAKLREAGVSVDFSKKFSLGGQKMEREGQVLDQITKAEIVKPSYRSFYDLLDDFIEELYEDGSVDRWKREAEERKASKKPRPCQYDRGAIMRSAWQYRKEEGCSMSAALKLAWAENKAEYERLLEVHKEQLALKREKPTARNYNFVESKRKMEVIYGA